MKVKNTSIFHLSEALISAKQVTTYAGEDVDQMDHSPLLLGVQTCTTIMEISIVVPQNTGNPSTPQHPTISLLDINPKNIPTLPQRHFLSYVHSSFIHNIQKLETT